MTSITLAPDEQNAMLEKLPSFETSAFIWTPQDTRGAKQNNLKIPIRFSFLIIYQKLPRSFGAGIRLQ